MSTSATVTILCRHCGRPIIGTPMKMGGAGDAYHAECTMPPRRATLEDVRTFFLEKRAEGLSDREILELLF